jgi:polar amino acid transport system substrate-binding protein
MRYLVVLAFVLAGCATQPPVDSSVRSSFAPGGKLRAAINFGNTVLAQRDPASGEPRGISADLARELSRELGLPLEFVLYTAAGQVTDAARKNAWDVAFIAIDPKRAEEIDFTAPYVLIEGAYMVPAGSPLRTNADVDRKGVRVSVGAKSAYDLYLTRTLKNAQIVRAPTSPGAIDIFLKDRLEVAAGVKQPLVEFAKANPSVRVMDGRFMSIEQAMATPKGRAAAHAYLRDFVERMKANGFVARGLERSKQPDAVVAPASSGN